MSAILGRGSGSGTEPEQFPYIEGARQMTSDGAATTNNTQGNGVLRAFSKRCWAPFRITAASPEIGTAGQAGAVLRLGVYAFHPSGQFPLLEDFGTFAADSTNTLPWRNVDLEIRRHWLPACVIQEAGTTQPTVVITQSPPVDMPMPSVNITGLPSFNAGPRVSYVHNATLTTGPLPETFVASSTSSQMPRLHFRVAAL